MNLTQETAKQAMLAFAVVAARGTSQDAEAYCRQFLIACIDQLPEEKPMEAQEHAKLVASKEMCRYILNKVAPIMTEKTHNEVVAFLEAALKRLPSQAAISRYKVRRKVRKPKFIYTTSCVSASAHSINEMMNSANEIGYDTIRRSCNIRGFIARMGYAKDKREGLTLAEDHHVSYYKAKFRGKPAYVIRHSAIEYIWTETGET